MNGEYICAYMINVEHINSHKIPKSQVLTNKEEINKIKKSTLNSKSIILDCAKGGGNFCINFKINILLSSLLIMPSAGRQLQAS